MYLNAIIYQGSKAAYLAKYVVGSNMWPTKITKLPPTQTKVPPQNWMQPSLPRVFAIHNSGHFSMNDTMQAQSLVYQSTSIAKVAAQFLC